MARGISAYRNTLILSGVVILAVIFIYIAVNRRNKQQEIADINAIIDNDVDVAGTYEDLVKSDALNPSFHNSYTFTASDIEKARGYAKDLYDAVGTWQFDHPDTVYSTLNSAGSKAFVSLIADQFQQAYGTTVYEHLNSHLDANEMSQVNQIIKSLPDSN